MTRLALRVAIEVGEQDITDLNGRVKGRLYVQDCVGEFYLRMMSVS